MTEVIHPDDSNSSLPAWAAIAEAGGIRRWIDSELERRGLRESVDFQSLSAKEKRAFKARRDEERRVRRELKRHAWTEYKKAHVVHLGRGVFYHDTPDYDRYDIGSIDELTARREDNGLPDLPDARALAKALEISIGTLRWLAFHRQVDSGTHYRRWTVPKRDGRLRLISEPKPELKRVQRYIVRHITERLPMHGAAHGFVPGRSTVTNAAVHAGAKVIVKLDLADFYPSITMPRVKGLFRKAGYGEQVATLLAMLCTESPREEITLRGKLRYVATGPRSLPQGAPSSPSITNALSLRLDLRLWGMADKFGFRYTRYADDLTFSFHGEGNAGIAKLQRFAEQIIEAEGFTVNRKKTRVMRHGRRQSVTGLVVNAPLNQVPSSPGEAIAASPARVPRKTLRRLRAAIKNRELGREGKGESLAQLRGWAAYVYMTDPKKGRAMLDRLAKLGPSGGPDRSPTPEEGTNDV